MELKTTDEEHVQPWNRSSNKRIEDSNRKKEKAKLLFQVCFLFLLLFSKYSKNSD